MKYIFLLMLVFSYAHAATFQERLEAIGVFFVDGKISEAEGPNLRHFMAKCGFGSSNIKVFIRDAINNSDEAKISCLESAYADFLVEKDLEQQVRQRQEAFDGAVVSKKNALLLIMMKEYLIQNNIDPDLL